ncbi:MAG: hypothetical protein HYY45_07060 [Deltaproteobacteria bacterium]|nr:hypothetical protein [Deltaproteobacteria bacterium]
MKRKRTAPTHSHESSTTGRVAELFLGSILLSNGFEVYSPMVDVAIDCLAISPRGSQLRFQCKSRSKQDATVFDLSLPKDKRATLPTHVFYMRGPADRAEYWIVPFPVVKRYTKRSKGRTGRVIYRLYLTEESRRALRDYRNEDGVKEVIRWKGNKSQSA